MKNVIWQYFYTPITKNTQNEVGLKKWLNYFYILFCFFAICILLEAVVWNVLPAINMVGEDNKFRDKAFALLFLMFPWLATANWVVFRKFNSFENRFFSLIRWSVLLGIVVVVTLLWNEPVSDGSFRSYVNKWWPGFSVAQFTLGCCLAAILVYAVLNDKASKLLIFFKIAAPIIVIAYLLLWLEFPWGVREGTFPALEEILSPSAGAVPTINFTAQYINLLGLPIVPFTFLFPKASVLIAYIWVDLLKIASLIFALYFLRFTINKKWISLLIILVVTLPSMSGINGFYLDSNPTSYWAVFPLRLVLPLGLGALLMWAIQTSPSRKIILLLGVASAITAWNNTDWGIPAAGAALIVLLLGADSISEAFRRLMYFFTGAALFIACYIVILKIATGYWVDPVALIYFAKVFVGKGTISFPMLGWGLHTIVLGTFVLVSSVGIVGYSKLGKSFYGHRTPYFAGLVYVGIFSLGASLYFINRALLPVLESLFLPWSLCIALAVYGAVRFLEQGRSIPAVFPTVVFLTVPVFVIFGVTSMSILNGPHLKTEWQRIKGANPAPGWLSSIESRAALVKTKIQTSGESRSVGLISNNSAAIASRLGIKSVTGFWGPMPIDYPNTFDQICWAIQRSHVKSLLVEPHEVYSFALDKFEKCLEPGSDLIWLSDLPGSSIVAAPSINLIELPKGNATYQFISAQEKYVKLLENFPPTLPLIQFRIKLEDAGKIDSIDITAPDGLGEWTTLPIDNLWGIGIIEEGGISNTGSRKEKLGLPVDRNLTLWVPDNGNLSKCPELHAELTLADGKRLSAFANCKRQANIK